MKNVSREDSLVIASLTAEKILHYYKTKKIEGIDTVSEKCAQYIDEIVTSAAKESFSNIEELTEEEKAENFRLRHTIPWIEWVMKSSKTSDGYKFSVMYCVKEVSPGQWGIVSSTLGQSSPFTSPCKKIIMSMFNEVARNFGR